MYYDRHNNLIGPGGDNAKRRRARRKQSFIQQKSNQQRELVFGYDKYSEEWMPRHEMHSINLIGECHEENNESQTKIPLRMSPDAYDDIMGFIDSLSLYTVTVKGFGDEKEEVTLTMTPDMYYAFMEHFEKYEWDNKLLTKEELDAHLRDDD